MWLGSSRATSWGVGERGHRIMMEGHWAHVIDLVYVCVMKLDQLMNAYEFINHDWNLMQNNPYIPIEEEILGMHDGKDFAAYNEPIEENDNVQLGDMVIDKVGCKDIESALVSSKQILETKKS